MALATQFANMTSGQMMTNISATDLANLMADESFLRWISDNGSPQEVEKWNAWLNESIINQSMYTEAVRLRKSIVFCSTPEPQTDKALARLNDQLDQASLQLQADLTNSVNRRFPVRQHISWWMAVAAIAAVLLLAGAWHLTNLWQAQPFQTLATQFKERQQIYLPDGSFIVLNANSTLRFRKDADANTRREFYLSGEAYFEVAPRPNSANKEFIVHTVDGSVTVLGTVFVVYDRGGGTRVVLEEGSIKITAHAGDINNENAGVNLKPGEVLRFRKGVRMPEPESGATKLYTSWWKQSFVLDKTSVEELAQRIRETYGVKLEIQDPDLATRILAGSIENHNLDLILKAVSSILNAPVQRQGDIILLGNKPGKK